MLEDLRILIALLGNAAWQVLPTMVKTCPSNGE